MATLTRVIYTPDAENKLANVNLTEPGTVVFPAGASAFPTTVDKEKLKTLTYQAPSSATMKTKLGRYHTLMAKVTSGTNTAGELTELKALLIEIRSYVLTEDDLNLMVDSINKIQEYIYTFLKPDLAAKAAKLDVVMGEFVLTMNEFMTDLEQKYNDSPSNYPIPMLSILFTKLEMRLQNSIVYNEGTLGTIVSPTQPARPINRSIVWIDTNMADAD